MVASMTVIWAMGYFSRIRERAFCADCMEPLNFVVMQMQITGVPALAKGRNASS